MTRDVGDKVKSRIILHRYLIILAVVILIAATNILIVELTMRNTVKRIDLGITMEDLEVCIGPPDKIGRYCQRMNEESKGQQYARYYFPYLWDWATVPFMMYELTSRGKVIPPFGRFLEITFDDEDTVESVVEWNHSRQEGRGVKFYAVILDDDDKVLRVEMPK